MCPCFPPATPERGNELRGSRVLINRVSWPAELQTDCWLTQPSGRQHVWHHATFGRDEVLMVFSLLHAPCITLKALHDMKSK